MFEKRDSNVDRMREIYSKLQYHTILGSKYNHSIEGNNFQSKVFIEFSMDLKQILMTKRIPVEDQDFTHEQDPNLLEVLVKEAHEAHKQKYIARQNQTIQQMKQDKDFVQKKCYTPCNVNEITGIIFGGFSARF